MMFMLWAMVFISLVTAWSHGAQMLIERLSNHAAVKHQDVAAERVKRTCTVPCKQRMVTTHHAVTMPCTQRIQTCVKPSHAHDKYDRDEHAPTA